MFSITHILNKYYLNHLHVKTMPQVKTNFAKSYARFALLCGKLKSSSGPFGITPVGLIVL